MGVVGWTPVGAVLAGGSDASRLRSGLCYTVPGTGSTLLMVLNRLYFAPFESGGGPLDRIGIGVTGAAATSVIRLGVYLPGTNDLPNALAWEAPGTVDGSVAQDTLAAMLTVAESLPAGRCFLAAVVQTAACTVRASSQRALLLGYSAASASQPAGYSQEGVTGALPATATAPALQSLVPRPHIRAA